MHVIILPLVVLQLSVLLGLKYCICLVDTPGEVNGHLWTHRIRGAVS